MAISIKSIIGGIPLLGPVIRRAYWHLTVNPPAPPRFTTSERYWEERYATGGNSGDGSYGHFAEFKATVVNDFVRARRIESVIEFGCGDGNQLSLAKYPEYFGLDMSPTAIDHCRTRFGDDGTKRFATLAEYQGERAELGLSLDVIYHLVEDGVFGRYLDLLFSASRRFVIIYSSDRDDDGHSDSEHVRHRKFTRWIGDHITDWTLMEHIPNKYPYRQGKGSFADFFIYRSNAG